MQCPLTISDVIEIVGIVASLITSIVAICISVKTLKQNSSMVEESTRPYVSIYIGTTHFSAITVYMIIKNFGSSLATITAFNCDLNLVSYAYDKERIPFANIVGTSLCPGEAIQYPIRLENCDDSIKFLNINICYKSSSKEYFEHISLNLSAYFEAVHVRVKSDLSISYALQDIAEKML